MQTLSYSRDDLNYDYSMMVSRIVDDGKSETFAINEASKWRDKKIQEVWGINTQRHKQWVSRKAAENE